MSHGRTPPIAAGHRNRPNFGTRQPLASNRRPPGKSAPRFTSERTPSLLGKTVHGALAVIRLRWSARSPGRRAFAPGVAIRASNISGANELAGSQVGSQGGPTSGDARPRPAIIGAGGCHARPCQATPGDGGDVLWEQEAAGSNPAIPTSSEHMSILVALILGAKLGAKC